MRAPGTPQMLGEHVPARRALASPRSSAGCRSRPGCPQLPRTKEPLTGPPASGSALLQRARPTRCARLTQSSRGRGTSPATYPRQSRGHRHGRPAGVQGGERRHAMGRRVPNATSEDPASQKRQSRHLTTEQTPLQTSPASAAALRPVRAAVSTKRIDNPYRVQRLPVLQVLAQQRAAPRRHGRGNDQ